MKPTYIKFICILLLILVIFFSYPFYTWYITFFSVPDSSIYGDMAPMGIVIILIFVIVFTLISTIDKPF